jgi:chaperonin GroES
MASVIKKLIPILDRVLVERVIPKAKTVGGILLPETAQAKINEGLIIAVGGGMRDKAGTLIPMNVAVGDKVLLPEWGGNAIKVDDKEYHIFRDSDILAKIE